MSRWNCIPSKWFLASPSSVRKCTKRRVRLTLELLEGRELPSADPLTQAITVPLAVQAGSAIAGAPLSPSSDTDGSGNISGGLGGQFGAPGDSFSFTNGVIGGGLSGSFSASGHINGGNPSNFGGNISSISGILGDGSTLSGGGGLSGSISGSALSGTFSFNGINSEHDDISGSGSFSGTVDGNGNVTSGSFTGTITVTEPTNNDTLVWNPQNGSTDASDEHNWYDQTLGRPSFIAPGAGNPVIFDGSPTSQTPYDTSPITWTTSVTIASMTLENGYTAQQTIEDNITLTMNGFQDNNVGLNNFLVAFAGPNADLNFGPGQDVEGNFNWQAGGQITVNGGLVMIGRQANLNQSTASPVTINSGTVDIGPATANSGTSTFTLANSSANITVNRNGYLNFYMPTFAGTHFLVDNMKAGAQISNNGQTYLNNAPGNGWGTINAPFANHGTLDASAGGQWKFNRADANNNDLSMDAGKITLGGGVSIGFSDGYTQTGGTLEVADNSHNSFFLTFAGGTTNFTGGKIVFDSTTGYGWVSFCDNVIFNGVEIDMRINGANANSDLIQLAGGTCTIKGNSKLVVTATNPVVKGSGITWTLIQAGNTGGKIINDFNGGNVTLPPNVTENKAALPNFWECNS